MRNIPGLASVAVMALCAACPPTVRAGTDAPGCRDGLVTRAPGFHIWRCDHKDSGFFTFAEGSRAQKRVSGRVVENWYSVEDGNAGPGSAAVRRHYDNALHRAGWSIVYSDPEMLTAEQTQGAEENWLQLAANDGSSYQIMQVRVGAESTPAPTGGMPSGSREYLADLRERMTLGTAWAASARDGETLWNEVRGALSNLLIVEWQAGRLRGTRSGEAFSVRCDRSTMSQADIDSGRLICLVGVATQRPAEFVNVRIQQQTLGP
jgi:hypothetical protein